MSRGKSAERGSAREDLIQAGIEILKEKGSDGLTLRGIAARAGLSHAAPAHYFDGLSGLRIAIAVRGFEKFAQAMEERGAAATDSDFNHLLATGEGYIDFASTNPGLFRLMFDELLQPTPELALVACESYMVLRRACAPFTSVKEGDKLEMLAWSLVHTYASLRLVGPMATLMPFRAPSVSDALQYLLRENADP